MVTALQPSRRPHGFTQTYDFVGLAVFVSDKFITWTIPAGRKSERAPTVLSGISAFRVLVELEESGLQFQDFSTARALPLVA